MSSLATIMYVTSHFI